MMPGAGAGVEEPLAPEAPAPFLLSDDEILDLCATNQEGVLRAPLRLRAAVDAEHLLHSRTPVDRVLRPQWRLARQARGAVDSEACHEQVQGNADDHSAMFTAIKLGVNIRPTAPIQEHQCSGDRRRLAPLLYETHDMTGCSRVRLLADATGNAFMHSFVDFDVKYGRRPSGLNSAWAAWPSTVRMNSRQECLPRVRRHRVPDGDGPETGQPVQNSSRRASRRRLPCRAGNRLPELLRPLRRSAVCRATALADEAVLRAPSAVECLRRPDQVAEGSTRPIAAVVPLAGQPQRSWLVNAYLDKQTSLKRRRAGVRSLVQALWEVSRWAGLPHCRR